MAEGGAVDARSVGTAVAASPPRRRRRVLRGVLLLLGPAVVIAGATLLWLAGGRYVSTDNAYVRADKVTVSTDVSGIVEAVLVTDNQAVDADTALFRLDPEPFAIAVASASAAYASALTEIATLRANFRQRQEEIRLAEADLAFQGREHQRQAALAARRVAAPAALDQARIALDRARQRLAAAREEANAVLAALGGDAASDPADHPRVRQAQAALDRAERELRRTTVRAPIAGIVANASALQGGEYLEAGKPAFTLVSSEQVWIEANPKETDLTHVRTGNPVTVRIDTYPDHVWQGRVASVSPASGAEFALLPPQNATGNWIKVVQRIPLRIEIEPAAGAPPLRSGMSAVISIDTGRERTFASLVHDVAHWFGIAW